MRMPEWNDKTIPFDYNTAAQRLEEEFHFWVDVAKVDEDSLHAVWAFMIIRRWYPGVRAETIDELINRIGWH